MLCLYKFLLYRFFGHQTKSETIPRTKNQKIGSRKTKFYRSCMYIDNQISLIRIYNNLYNCFT